MDESDLLKKWAIFKWARLASCTFAEGKMIKKYAYLLRAYSQSDEAISFQQKKNNFARYLYTATLHALSRRYHLQWLCLVDEMCWVECVSRAILAELWAQWVDCICQNERYRFPRMIHARLTWFGLTECERVYREFAHAYQKKHIKTYHWLENERKKKVNDFKMILYTKTNPRIIFMLGVFFFCSWCSIKILKMVKISYVCKCVPFHEFTYSEIIPII